MPISTDLLRDHARFVEARCPDGETVARDMLEAAAEIERLLAAIIRYVQAVEASNTNVFEDGTAAVGALALEENRAYLALEAEAAKEE